MKDVFFSKDLVICDLVWTHPDIYTVYNERVQDPEFDQVYISYQIFQYPSDRISEISELEPQFIFTKRGCVDPKFAVYKTRSGVFKRLEKEKENFDKDVRNFRALLMMGRVART